jgi:hypothetical protein
MTEPARDIDDPPSVVSAVPVDNALLSDTEKIEVMRQQLEWLCVNVSGLLNMAASNPMFKMLLRKGMGNG